MIHGVWLMSLLILLFGVWFFFRRIYQVRIIAPKNSIGLKIDAELYSSIIPRSYVVYVNWKSPRRHIEYYRLAYKNIYIERSETERGFPAIKKHLVPNPEFFDVKGKLPEVFLCKTKHAVELLSPLNECRYVGHSSFDVKKYTIEKNENLVVMFAGKSWLKNVDVTIQAWLKHPEYPRLLITCAKKLLPKELDLNHLPDNLSIYEYMDEEEKHRYAAEAGAFLCPSSIEGFGHYLNEGRAAGTIVITTNFPPMNELVDEEIGILIEPYTTEPAHNLVGRQHFGFDYVDAFELKAAKLTVNNIEDAMNRYLKMSAEERLRKRLKARERYLTDHGKWRKNLLAALSE